MGAWVRYLCPIRILFQAYCAFITNPIRWGGQVELSILAKSLSVELAVTEVSSGRLDVYGEGQGYSRRAYLSYTGLHFDAIVFGSDTRAVSPAGDPAAAAAVRRLMASEKSSGGFVDQATMRLRCKICGFVAEGDYAARAHAGGTGHKEFAPG